MPFAAGFTQRFSFRSGRWAGISGPPLLVAGQHRAIYETIEAGEGARAEALSREHARLARQNLRQALETLDKSKVSQIPGLSLVSAKEELSA